METTTTRCECGNAATETLENGTPACDYCAAHDGHVAPINITTGHTLLGGEYVARCNDCHYVCAYWDCPCELAHDCPGMVSVVSGSYKDPAGYYPYGDDGEPIGIALCRDCARIPDPFGGRGDNMDEPIGYWHETDAPVHCDDCDALLVTTLTVHGVEYVRESLAYWRDGGRYGNGTTVLAAWECTFADVIGMLGGAR